MCIRDSSERHRTGHRHTPFSITVHQSPNLRCLYGRGRPAWLSFGGGRKCVCRKSRYCWNTRNGRTFPRADRTCMAAVLSRQGSRTDGPLHPSGTDETDIGKMDKSSRKRTSVTGLSMFQTAAVLIMMQVVKFLRWFAKHLKIWPLFIVKIPYCSALGDFYVKWYVVYFKPFLTKSS